MRRSYVTVTMKRYLVLGLLGLSAVGCGSDGTSTGTPADDGNGCSTGSLVVSVTGLPAGAAAKVNVTGASGALTVGATETLKLTSGSYGITADTVVVADPIVRSVYTATVSAATEDVVCGSSDLRTVNVTYALIPSSNKLWIGSENSDSNTLGYASATLAATGTKDADITATTAGSLPGAFDRAGNLWVIDGTGGEVGVKRYPAATLAGGGIETPDITLSGDALTGGVPGPASLAFDPSGNLWVGVAYSSEVVEFAAAQLSTSTDTAVPDVEISAVPAPAALAFDAKGNLWVGSGNDVLEYPVAALAASNGDPPAVTIDSQTPEPVVSPLSNVLGLAFNSAGKLWVNYDGMLALLTSLESGLGTPEIQVQADVLALPAGIALDESGGLWLAYSAGKFAKFSASQLLSSGSVTPAVVITSSSLGSATSPAFFPAPSGLGLYSSLE
jgi:hypothetical protein